MRLDPSRRPSSIGIAKTFQATEITVTGPVRMAGQPLPAGTYSLFTVPGADAWEVRIHPGLGMDGTGRLDADGGFREVYDPSLDLVVARIAPGSLAEPVEQSSFDFEAAEAGAHMVLRWERTEVRVPVKAGR